MTRNTAVWSTIPEAAHLMKKPSGRAHASKHLFCPARRCVPEATWVSLSGGTVGAKDLGSVIPASCLKLLPVRRDCCDGFRWKKE